MCARCLRGRDEDEYFRAGHLLSPHKLPVCEECFDGCKTRMDRKDGYFGDYVDPCKEMEDEARQGYEERKGS